ncbi:hypothetical protein AAH678_28275 [Sodalis endosymbiont of Spalangia cameroni]|uniref:hypothetical protein n=1 Tax=Sodalis praecaptivus TaxID=1239307 RepID=UPI0031F9B885
MVKLEILKESEGAVGIAVILNVPRSYFFCEDELSAELVVIFQKLDNKKNLIIINILKCV